MCIHNWKPVYEEYTDYFLGKPVVKKFKSYEICRKCAYARKIEEDSQCEYWRYLSEDEGFTLLQEVINKGDYLLLPIKETREKHLCPLVK